MRKRNVFLLLGALCLLAALGLTVWNLQTAGRAQIAAAAAVQVEDMITGDWDLTLFTCTPGGQLRIAVRCLRADA